MSAVNKHKVFISYHHDRDQGCKEKLVELGEQHDIFADRSVDTGDISEELSDEQIRVKIRDDYLQDSTVTIVLVGAETKYRKHVDWEIHSSMHDGELNKRSGILVVNLLAMAGGNEPLVCAAHSGEEESVYPEIRDWTSVNSRQEWERLYPNMPNRILDNLIINDRAKISVTNWRWIQDPVKLKLLIDMAYRDRNSCKYDLSQPMMRRSS